MVVPEVRAVGAKAQGKATEQEVGAPAGVTTGDLEILVATTIAGGSVTIPSNGGGAWTAVGEPIDVTGGEKLYAWQRVRVGGDGNPKVKAGSDHICACRIAVKAGSFDPTAPIEAARVGSEVTSDTSFAFKPEKETGGGERLCFVVCSSGVDSETGQAGTNTANSSLTSVVLDLEYQTKEEGGGGFWVAHGTRATQGTVGEWTQTMVSATPKAYIAFSVAPVPLTIPCAAAGGQSGGALALSAPTTIPMGAATAVAAVGAATVETPSPTTIPCATSAALTGAALALAAPTQIPLAAAITSSSAMLLLIAPTQVPCAASGALSAAALSISAPTAIPCAASAGQSSAVLTVSVSTSVPLGPASAESAAGLLLQADTTIPMGPASALADTALILTASAFVTCDPSATLSSASVALSVPGAALPILSPASAQSAAVALLAAPTQITPSPSAAGTSTSLTLAAPITLIPAPTDATSAAGAITFSGFGPSPSPPPALSAFIPGEGEGRVAGGYDGGMAITRRERGGLVR